MKRPWLTVASAWSQLAPRYLPFADAASETLPLARLLRLSLFQISVGMAMVLAHGVLNRVMIVELGVAAWLVAIMVSLPLLFAPFRVVVGFRSDTHRSFLGWRRVPYLWMGTLLQFGGFAIMPFALLVLSGAGAGSAVYGQFGVALAFLLVGAGLHTTQTAGLALAMDIAPEEDRPRVVALLYCVLLLGMMGSAVMFGWLLEAFSPLRLIRVIQGAALVTLMLNVIALWKQEARDPARTAPHLPRAKFGAAWREFSAQPHVRRFLFAVALGTAGFSMQDILLEPYGGQVMQLSVGGTTSLTALMAGGALGAFVMAGRLLLRGGDPCRLAGIGGVSGICALAAIMLAEPLHSLGLFRVGTLLLGFGAGLFAVGTLTIATALQRSEHHTGLALGAWGAVQATAAGLAIAIGGGLRDFVSGLAEQGVLGSVLRDPGTGYAAVYQIEILLLFAMLVALGPLVRVAPGRSQTLGTGRLGLADLPG